MSYAPLGERNSRTNSTGGRAARRPLAGPFPAARLRISSPSDPLEQEADRVAAQVLRSPAGSRRREQNVAPPRCSACESTGEEIVHRKCAACERDEELEISRSAAAPGAPAVSQELHHSIVDLQRAGGRPLPQPVRSDMESRFGHDFGAVRIHEGSRAAALVQRLNARAFTVGSHIAFGSGKFAPARPEGRRLLAHELVHTLQHGPRSPVIARALARSEVRDEMTEVAGMRAEQTGQVVACGPAIGRPPGEVARAHSLAVQMTTTAYNALPAAPDLLVPGAAQLSPRVRERANLWFQLQWPARDDRERSLWRHMLHGVRALRSGGPNTQYKCSPCNQAGLVLPGSPYVRLCDGWWETTSLNKRAAIIIHEWGHFWGGRAGLMRRVFESYCGRKRFNAMSAAKLVQMPDAYMGFIYEVATNSDLTPDSVCKRNAQLHPGDDAADPH